MKQREVRRDDEIRETRERLERKHERTEAGWDSE